MERWQEKVRCLIAETQAISIDCDFEFFLHLSPMIQTKTEKFIVVCKEYNTIDFFATKRSVYGPDVFEMFEKLKFRPCQIHRFYGNNITET